MDVRNFQSNVVIVAKQFNPSILDKHWMISNDILAEEDFEPNCIFAPMISQINAREFNLLVLPDQLQFTPLQLTETTGELVALKVGSIVEKLPHTPYVAAGLNFIWRLSPQTEEFGVYNRSLFYRDSIPLYEEFNSDDARFGVYLSKNEFGCRLKLDIKPVISKQNTDKKEYLQFSFNYHRDFSEKNNIADILTFLNTWKQAEELAVKIVDSLANWRKV